ncbi:MAG TPA: ABC transporter permease [Candidatus Angelobacter sp.]|nr:ABC transporter permease [Candidatus Angelobacter sp.]
MNALGISRLLAQPWFYASAGAILVWLVIVGHSQGAGGGAVISAALNYSVFFAVVGLGQMLVMASGAGNIDLSIPANITLAAYLSTGQMVGSDSGLVAGFVAGLAGGIAIGAANALLILAFRIPPMVATLASGLVVESFTFVYSRISVAKPSPLLADFTTERFAGVPYVTLAAIFASVALIVVLRRSLFGRSLFACGQNETAAWLSGVNVRRTRVAAYVLCGAFTSLAGILFAGFTGGPSLNMGSEFLLSSIAVVVIGGTNVAGGQASVLGTWSASLFLFLLLSMLNVLQVGPGLRNVITGVLIIAVLALNKTNRMQLV